MNYIEHNLSPENLNLPSIQSIRLTSLVHSLVSAAVYVSPPTG